MNPLRILITGGARCGKSAFALRLAVRNYSRRTFVATAVNTDPEMNERISKHQLERGALFETIEEPTAPGRILATLPDSTEVAVVDCLTVWLGNLYHRSGGRQEQIQAEVDAFLSDMDHVSCDLVLVTNEVGWGIVPEHALARSFRDMAGYLNRKVAEKSTHVYLLCCGVPLALKGSLPDLH
ncbi:MAG: bifunctional adenosylcobinamide kinase/adenosylcobinamide-phosphate guanylyltransferase [Deltaproteobacteria bacterium HGW-Deltaproteobacteria-15]|jgi:adenosylcobinamide kinase/adenosylcobinamide-phosphate guanylyltransferase|nr:MAG: bifunctional adenosylcobinamide kinase/adenosylcobinamide-phosphate guanylyltransferase [Deltaproteobacteria bacterium HGW-Deltaproteobacteria-15]